MKKILVLLLCVLLAGCGSSTLAWDDVKEKYSAYDSEAMKLAEEYTTFLKGDYLKIIYAVQNGIDTLTAGIKKDEEVTAEELYQNAAVLEYLTSSNNSIYADKLAKLAVRIKDLVEAAYSKASDFAAIKDEITAEIEEVNSWNDEQWQQVEKHRLIPWSEVVEEYEAMEENISDDLKSAKEISENDLEVYKETIDNNYTAIQNGVTELNKKNADAMYEAGLILQYYLEDLKGDSPEKAYRLAASACDYVKQCYGEAASSEYNFLTEVKSAEKWTLSVWNEITTLLRK
ncbi:MAG: hypothetical protein IK151_05885 [Erysipelotrichaceae bacterium]|nr:hypothetical protein [Erysipelotrichaceae bacterium]